MEDKYRRFKFYYNNIESEIFEYKIDDFENEEELIYTMEEKRTDWLFSQFDSGYTEIK